jgi:hypothetical protein
MQPPSKRQVRARLTMGCSRLTGGCWLDNTVTRSGWLPVQMAEAGPAVTVDTDTRRQRKWKLIELQSMLDQPDQDAPGA